MPDWQWQLKVQWHFGCFPQEKHFFFGCQDFSTQGAPNCEAGIKTYPGETASFIPKFSDLWIYLLGPTTVPSCLHRCGCVVQYMYMHITFRRIVSRSCRISSLSWCLSCTISRLFFAVSGWRVLSGAVCEKTTESQVYMLMAVPLSFRWDFMRDSCQWMQ